MSCWETVRYVCSDVSQHSTHALVRLHVSHFSLPLRDLLCFACILLVAGTLHTGSALLGVVVLLVFCWELVHQVCPTESLGIARILLGIGQSLVSKWELEHLTGLIPTVNQCITSVLLGVSWLQASCWQSGHQLGAAASHLSPGWLGVSVSRVSCWELMGHICPSRSVCIAL